MSKGFVHLHGHSDIGSQLDSCCNVKKLVAHAKSQGSGAVTVSDHGSCAALAKFTSEAKDQGVKPILACELYISKGDHLAREDGYDHLVLIAESDEGYRNLIKLSSEGYLRGFYRKPRVSKDFLAANSAGLICLSACLAGDVQEAHIAGDYATARKLASGYRDIFGDRYYLEIQNHGLKEDKAVIDGNSRLSKDLGIKLVATADYHYITPEDYKGHEIVTCISMGKKLSDPDRMRFESNEFYMKSRAQMEACLPGFDHALDNTLEVAERCNAHVLKAEHPFPAFPTPQGMSLNDHFAHQVWEGFEKRSHALAAKAKAGKLKHGSEEYERRIEGEIQTICDMGYAGYFLIVQEMLQYAREKSIPVGPGRGSAAGSLACYCLGITNVDSLQYDLLFERMLNAGRRDSPPDIDSDVSPSGRADVIKHLSEKYGDDRVAQISTFGSLAAKQALKDVGRVLDMPFVDCQNLSNQVPTKPIGITLTQALEMPNSGLVKARENDPLASEVIDVALRIEGLTRGVGTHAAGIVISHDPIGETVPLIRTKDGGVATQYPMEQLEKLRLLKLDVLGLESLDIIDTCVKLVKKHRGIDIDLETLDLEDERVYRDIFSTGLTEGVFQFSSPSMKDLLRRLGPTDIHDISALNALFRPGPISAGIPDAYIRRKRGHEEITYQFPELEEILKPSLGLLVFQEQIMRTAQKLSSYTLVEADFLRKCLGKKKVEEMAEQKERFVSGAVANGYDQERVSALFDQIEAYSTYCFNASHSYAYSMVAFQTAYLKCYFPTEFYCALLSSERSDSGEILKYISEAKTIGIQILPPDINQSEGKFTPVGETVRFGLSAIRNAGEGSVTAILCDRESSGPYRDIFNFCSRVSNLAVNKRILETMVKAGAFDSIGPSRAKVFAAVETAMTAGKKEASDRAKGQSSMFDLFSAAEADDMEPVYGQEKEWSIEQKLKGERESIGIYVSGHPLDKYLAQTAFAPHSVASLEGLENGTIVILPALMTNTDIKTSKSGAKWVACRLEDQNGGIEAMVFGNRYQSLFGVIGEDKPILVRGQVMFEEGSTPKVSIQDAMPLEGFVSPAPRAICVEVPADADTAPEKLKRLVDCSRGRTAVRLAVTHGKKAIDMDLAQRVTFDGNLAAMIRQICGPESLRVA